MKKSEQFDFKEKINNLIMPRGGRKASTNDSRSNGKQKQLIQPKKGLKRKQNSDLDLDRVTSPVQQSPGETIAKDKSPRVGKQKKKSARTLFPTVQSSTQPEEQVFALQEGLRENPIPPKEHEVSKNLKCRGGAVVSKKAHESQEEQRIIDLHDQLLMDDGIQVMVSEEDNDFRSDYDSDEEISDTTDTVVEPNNSRGSGVGRDKPTSEDKSGQNSEERLLENPHLKNLFNKFFEEKLKEVVKSHGGLMVAQPGTSQGDAKINQGSINCSNNRVIASNAQDLTNHKVKSPSDTTLYRPALAAKKRMDFGNGLKISGCENTHLEGDTVLNKINDFVAGMRLEQEQREAAPRASGGRSTTVSMLDPEFQEAEKRVETSILEAEKFKATVANPPGKESVLLLDQGRTDEDFFQLMCHVDSNLRSKIENGEFVDLDKLLPRDRRHSDRSDEDRLEWVFRDGGTYLAPANNRDNKINGIRKWDQAFRVYAIIYCGAHPERAKEIWQYVEIIHTAANSFLWENVASYDYTFRQLMAFNPARSWATTYNQMWNICMKDPLNGNNKNRGYGNFGQSQQNNKANSTSGSTNNYKGHRRKSDYCWNFNKGIPCKFGSKCRFIERCSYCDAPGHGVIACPKLDKKDALRLANGRRNGSSQAGEHKN